MCTVFILQCKEGLAAFQATLADVEMPIVDVDAAVQVIMEALEHENHEKEIHRVVNQIAREERLFEHDEYDSGDVANRLYAASLRLAGAIKNKLHEHHAYVDGQFPYTFQKFLNHDTFYLRRKPDVPVASIHRP